MKVMILVTHLLGTGHLSRALTLGRAFVESGHEVFVVSGGMPAPQLDSAGITLFGLPPVRSDGIDFSRLLDQSGQVAGERYLQARCGALVQSVKHSQPDILITELFPFGRRSLGAEFKAALRAAHELPRKPLILSSIRDILAPPSKPAKAAATAAILDDFYDGVLVHSDPDIIPLDASWPLADIPAQRLHYTGFVAPKPAPPHPEGLGRDEILVSAGGGSVGQPIFHAAIEAARKMPNRRWRLLVGGQDSAARRTKLLQQVDGSQVLIEPVRRDFRQMLPLAAASVSMCGYNTALDLLQSGTPSVLIPFDDGKEVEQSLRARRLSDLSAVEVVPNADLTGQVLADAVARVIAEGSRAPMHPGMNGAHRSVEIATSLAEAKQ